MNEETALVIGIYLVGYAVFLFSARFFKVKLSNNKFMVSMITLLYIVSCCSTLFIIHPK